MAHVPQPSPGLSYASPIQFRGLLPLREAASEPSNGSRVKADTRSPALVCWDFPLIREPVFKD